MHKVFEIVVGVIICFLLLSIAVLLATLTVNIWINGIVITG